MHGRNTVNMQYKESENIGQIQKTYTDARHEHTYENGQSAKGILRGWVRILLFNDVFFQLTFSTDQ